MAERIVVLGGTRSGKSAVAEELVAAAGRVVYVATGVDGDAEMSERIAAHRTRRPGHWRTVETTDVAGAVRGAPWDAAVLVDALGPWLARRMGDHGLWTELPVAPLGAAGTAGRERVLAEADALWAAARDHPGGPVVVVADESGLGVVPADASTRRWVDLAGEVVQRLAADADRVLFVVAGQPLETGGETRGVTGGVSDHPRAPGEIRHTPGIGAHGDTMVPPGAVDFAVNVFGDGPPRHIRSALEAALDEAGRYPDDGPTRAVLAARHHRPAGEVLVTAGAAEAFWLLARVTAARRPVCVHPSFTEPESALRAVGHAVGHVLRREEDGWALRPERVPDEADLVVVGNPNNPTGTLDDPDRLASLCRPGRITVVDEAFIDFVPEPAAASLAARRDLPGLVVVRSVTKLWGLAGVRAGYALAPAGLVARCKAARQPWSVGAQGLAALRACAGDEAYRSEVAERIAAARDRLAADLARLPGVTVAPAAANFLLVRVPDGPAVHAALLARGVAVRPCTFPGLAPDYLRCAVRDEETNRVLVESLRAVLSPATGSRHPVDSARR